MPGVSANSASVNQDLMWSDVPLEDHYSDEGLEVAMQNLAAPQFSVTDVCLQLTSYQSGPVDASDSMYRTGYRAVGVLHAPSADEYYDIGAKHKDIPEVQLASPPTTIQAPCPAASCQWRDEGAATICGEEISCKNVPQHLRMHGIKDKNRGEDVICKWEGCSASSKRNNIARHIYERHLGHHRDKGHSS